MNEKIEDIITDSLKKQLEGYIVDDNWILQLRLFAGKSWQELIDKINKWLIETKGLIAKRIEWGERFQTSCTLFWIVRYYKKVDKES